MRKDKKDSVPAFRLPPKADKKKEAEPVEEVKPDARALLKKAMARHDLHASGAEVADEKSNAKLREELQAALDALSEDEKE